MGEQPGCLLVSVLTCLLTHLRVAVLSQAEQHRRTHSRAARHGRLTDAGEGAILTLAMLTTAMSLFCYSTYSTYCGYIHPGAREERPAGGGARYAALQGGERPYTLTLYPKP